MGSIARQYSGQVMQGQPGQVMQGQHTQQWIEQIPSTSSAPMVQSFKSLSKNLGSAGQGPASRVASPSPVHVRMASPPPVQMRSVPSSHAPEAPMTARQPQNPAMNP